MVNEFKDADQEIQSRNPVCKEYMTVEGSWLEFRFGFLIVWSNNTEQHSN